MELLQLVQGSVLLAQMARPQLSQLLSPLVVRPVVLLGLDPGPLNLRLDQRLALQSTLLCY